MSIGLNNLKFFGDLQSSLVMCSNNQEEGMRPF